MQKTIIIQGTGIVQITVCDLCGKESVLPQFEGWRRFINYRQCLRQDICHECLQACLTPLTPDAACAPASDGNSTKRGAADV